MSDLVSREAVIERIKRMADGYSYLEVPTDYLIQELKKIEDAPTIDAVPVKDGTLKARSGNYVTYRIDWLLDHLAQEISYLCLKGTGEEGKKMDDLISRQAAIDALNTVYNEWQTQESCSALEEATSMIEGLPSAQTEIIRCKDCKWWDKSEDSPFGYCMAMKHGYFSANWEIGIYRRYKGDFYCADAERKES